MENFKEKLKKRIRFNTIMIITLVVTALMITLAQKLWGKANHEDVVSFITGFFCGFGGIFIYKIISYKKALGNEKILKTIFINETDERVLSIHFKAGLLSFKVSIIVLSIVAMIFGFINIIVFYALFSAVFILIIVQVISKIIYSKKY